MPLDARPLAATLLLLAAVARPAVGGPITVTVEAGVHARRDTPVRARLADDRLGPESRAALEAGPIALRLVPSAGGDPVVAQAERADGGVRLTWVEPGPIAAGGLKRYRLEGARPSGDRGPWRVVRSKGGVDLRHGERPVFRYNTEPLSSPDFGPILRRDAYLHPVVTPRGAIITGDFSKFHPHHRGIFLAYAKAEVEGEALDFWNFHTGKGKIRHDGLDPDVVGPVTARISAHHRWEGKDGRVLIKERWEVEAYEVPGSPYWCFDLTATQRAADRPVTLLPYRYGGMAYRGPDPFVKGPIDVLTAEGRHRVDGNLQPTRWVDLTGPIAEGSADYAGAMLADHPGNLHHPTVARIHPTTLPFFSFVPASREPVVIAKDAPLVLRYRILVHDGRPAADLDHRTWDDFADPPRVTVEGPDGDPTTR